MDIRVSRLIVLAVSSTVVSGCTVLLPAHHRSNERTGEKVSLTPIRCDKISTLPQEWHDNYLAAYKSPAMKSCDAIFLQTKVIKECAPPKLIGSGGATAVVAPAAAIASAAVGLATDFIKIKLEEEKTLYTAQYAARLVDDQFWTNVNFTARKVVPCTLIDGRTGEQTVEGYTLNPNYIGLELKRTINSSNLIEEENHGENLASHIQYAFKISSDGRFFQVKPILFEMPYAKAKVLSNQAYTWIFPPTLLMKLFKISNNSADVQMDFSMEAYWTDRGKDFDGPKPIAAFKTEVSGYDMSKRDKLGPKKLSNDAGWLLAPPISDAIDRYAGTSAGNFKATVKVTERDTSEAVKIIETSEDWVSKGGRKLQDIIEEK